MSFQFKSNPFPSLGIEQEFHLIDPVTAELAPRVDDVLAALPASQRKRIAHELFHSVIESQSQVHRTPGELLKTITQDRQALGHACESLGLRLAASASHPFADWRRERFLPDSHYKWVQNECGYVARRLLSYGLHIHVGMRNARNAIYVINEFRRWLYPVLALSSNSPYFEGEDTGLATVRAHLMSSMPRAGMLPQVENLDIISNYYEKLLAAGDVESPGSLWWHIRPQPPLGTAEVRMLDLPTDVNRIAVIAAIIQAAMAHFQDACEADAPQTSLDRVFLEENQWRATRNGLDTKIVDPATGEVLEMREQIRRLLDLVESKAEELGSRKFINQARDMLEHPTEAEQQRKFVADGHDLRELELLIADRTVAPG